MPRIIDNIAIHLKPALQETLQHSAVSLDASVGYFNVRGWSALCDDVSKLAIPEGRPTVRLLIGMQDRDTKLRESLSIVRRLQVMDNATASRLAREAALELREQLTWGIPSASDERTIRTLRAQLQDGTVRVKLFLRHNLHAKLYLCHRSDPVNPRIGFVGSSNLTFSGLGGQGELNVDVLDHDSTEQLHSWFNKRWSDNFSLDITEELIAILDESWAADRIVDPYLIHLKIAWHLSRDARAGLVEFGLPESMKRKLLEYQSAAVRITARNLLARGGAMVGDVVGLGKTIVATAVGLLLQEEHGFETLIVCPLNLVRMWQGYVDTYRLHARVLSLSMVHKELENLRRYRLLVIDESHNLRNASRRDYAALRDYVQLNDPRVLLLTATPFNKSMADVAGQLGLFIEEDQDLGIRPEAAIEAMGEIDFLTRCDDKPSTLRAFSLSEEPEDWQRLLAQFLVRRTRKFIDANYAEQDEDGRRYLTFGSGERNYLPERIARPLSHESSADDPASDMASLAVLGVIDHLVLPRYDLGNYLGPVDDEELTPDEIRVLRDLSRASGNLVGFTRTMLMKRLSSSGAVFILSLQRHLLRNHMYMSAIRDGGHVPVGSFTDRQTLDEEPAGEAIPGLEEAELPSTPEGGQWDALATLALHSLKEKDPAGISWVRASLFDARLLEALQADSAAIYRLLQRFGTWDHRRDSKLDALEQLLMETHPNEKVLIFSEYAEAAEYVAASLKLRGVDRVAAVTGETEDPTEMARRFSPVSNAELGPAPSVKDELRVLVSTDVLSEGQNLQDAAIVVNFDLPWAIIKLIQRAGRVDRIGQKADRVLVYTFLPAEGVESVIRLRARIAERLARSASVFGSDERFLNTADEAHLIENLFDENAQLPDDDNEQVDYASAAYEIWRNAEENHPDLARAAIDLPDVTYSTVAAADGDRRPGALVYTQSRFGIDRIALAPLVGAPIRLSPTEALATTSCEPDTPGLARMERHHDLVGEAVNGALAADEMATEGTLTGVRRRVYERVRNHLIDSSGTLFATDVEAEEAVAALYESPLTEQAKQSLARALRERTPDDLLALVVQLHEDGRLGIDVSDEVDEIQIVCSMGYAPLEGPA